jgi:hypothetical protein
MRTYESDAGRPASEAAPPRAAILADVRRLRALAGTALRDGMPKGALRARTARTAARALIATARVARLAPCSPAPAKTLLWRGAGRLVQCEEPSM